MLDLGTHALYRLLRGALQAGNQGLDLGCGAGGALGFADPEHRFAMGLAKGRMTDMAPGKDAASLVAMAIREALGIPEADA